MILKLKVFFSRFCSTIAVRCKMKTNQLYRFERDFLEWNFDSVLYMRHTPNSDINRGIDSDSNHHSSRDILSKSNSQRKHNCLNTL